MNIDPAKKKLKKKKIANKMSNADHLLVKARMGRCVRERERVQTFEDATNQAMYKK